MSVQRIAGIGAAIAGVGAFTGTLLAGRAEDSGPSPLLVDAGVAGAGALAIGGGVGLARWGEQALRPGVTRGARSAVAIGAALVTGAIAGTITSYVANRFGAHRATDDARTANAAADARAAAANSAAKEPGKVDDETARAKGLAGEAAKANVELQIDDGRVDLVGAPVSAAATALLNQYDTDGNGLRLAEQQRTVGDTTFSIGATMSSFLEGRDKDHVGDLPIENSAQLEKFLSDHVDTGGRSGIIDTDEARAWYADSGPGERNVTWGWKQHLASIASAPQGAYQDALDKDERETWTLGEFAEGTPMLALPGIEDLATAQRIAAEAAEEQDEAMAVVKLPEDAPTTYALATLRSNGDPIDSYLDEQDRIHGRLDPSVQLVTNGETTLRFDQARNGVTDTPQPAGAIPTSGRTVEAMATDIAERYDTGKDGLWIGDTQRTDKDGHTFSVAPMFIEANEARIDAKPGEFLEYETNAKLADAIRTVAAGTGDPKVLDGNELSLWNASYGQGERDITWGWDDLYKQVHDATDKADGDVQLAPFAENAKLLALPSIYSLDQALQWAQQVASASGDTVAVVDVPSGAPASYALARLTSGDGYDAELDGDLKKGKGLDSRVVGVANGTDRVKISR